MKRRALCYLAPVLLLLAAGPLAADSTADQKVWNHFLSWYKNYSGSVFPNEVAKAYAAVLAGEGLSEGEIKGRLALLQKIGANSPPEMMTLHFNKVYTAHPEFYTAAPTAFLARSIRGLKPGKALDVAMGQDRNSVFLAQQGWEVTGYDLSDEGLAQARANAAKAGVKIDAIQASHKDFDFGKECWDLIVMTYAFVSMDDAAFLQRVRDSLRPGGLVVVEQLNSGGPGKGPANALFKSFQDLRVLHYEDTEGTADWSQKPARLGRILAQKE